MASYENFARVYDLFMSDTPYDEWCSYLHGLLVKYGVADGLVLDLGCGTGAMTERLARLGYDMIGVDNSIDMLEIARENYEEHRFPGASTDILYLLQDMRAFELYGTVRAVVSTCDSMNYITEDEDLLQVFRLVNNYLDPGGVFIFDMNTEYKYRELLADHVFAENREEGSFIWENWYEEETQINEYDLTLYIRRELPRRISQMESFAPDECRDAGAEESQETDTDVCGKENQNRKTDICGKENQNPGADICAEEAQQPDSEESGEDVYERYEETHIQRAWSISRVRALLEEAGLRFEAVYDAFTEKEPHQKSERVYFIARQCGKLA